MVGIYKSNEFSGSGEEAVQTAVENSRALYDSEMSTVQPVLSFVITCQWLATVQCN